MTKKRFFTFLAACAFASPLLLSGQIIAAYEATISAPVDGGGGPTLWYQNADYRTGTNLDHMDSTGSAGNDAFRLAGQTYTDYFGNANKAFGLASNATASAAISSSSNLFMTGAQGTVSFLFKTGSDVSYINPNFESLFRQGSGFELILINNKVRLSYTSDGPKTLSIGPNLTADTWYYAALKWDTTKVSDDLTWYVGVAGSDTLATGTLNIDAAGGNTSIEIAGRTNANLFKDPMQEFAVWERELSAASIQQQFDATAVPEPSAYALMAGIICFGLILIRKRLRYNAG